MRSQANPIKDLRLAEAREAKRVATESWHQLAADCREAGLRLRRVTSAQYTIYGGQAPDDWFSLRRLTEDRDARMGREFEPAEQLDLA